MRSSFIKIPIKPAVVVAGKASVWINACLVALGGAFGSMLRYVLAEVIDRSGIFNGAGYPLGITIVNLVGCLIMGLLIGLGQTRFGWFDSYWRLLLLVGILGGFTTFSSFSYEIIATWQMGQFGIALVDAVIQVAGGLFAVWFGLKLGHWKL